MRSALPKSWRRTAEALKHSPLCFVRRLKSMQFWQLWDVLESGEAIARYLLERCAVGGKPPDSKEFEAASFCLPDILCQIVKVLLTAWRLFRAEHVGLLRLNLRGAKVEHFLRQSLGRNLAVAFFDFDTDGFAA